MYGMLHKQRYEQLHAEGTATQRAKGQRDDPEESAMYCGRVRPCGTTPHKMLPYLAGLTLPHRADGGVDANLMESPYLESWPSSAGCNTNGNTISRAKETTIVRLRWNGNVSCEGPHGGPAMPPFVHASALYYRIVYQCCEAGVVVYRRAMQALLELCGVFDFLIK